jgi:hypothetical protein
MRGRSRRRKRRRRRRTGKNINEIIRKFFRLLAFIFHSSWINRLVGLLSLTCSYIIIFINT